MRHPRSFSLSAANQPLRAIINPLVPSDTFALKLSYLGKTRAVKKAARIS
jgi:hypothetical protein